LPVSLALHNILVVVVGRDCCSPLYAKVGVELLLLVDVDVDTVVAEEEIILVNMGFGWPKAARVVAASIVVGSLLEIWR
jgi:hypothetical protein